MKEQINTKRTTTIAINIATSQAVESYCNKLGILKKDFVALAIKWFVNNNIDITSETQFTPVPIVPDKEPNQVELLCRLMGEFINTQQKSLPVTNNIDKITDMAKQLGTETAEKEVLQKRLDAAISELKRVEREQKTIGKININSIF